LHRPGTAARAAAAAAQGDPDMLTTKRRKALLRGAAPGDLYLTGMTAEEELFRSRLQIPDPPAAELFERLRALSSTFTKLKTDDLLKELPTKALLASYVAHFCHPSELERDLVAHFRIVRGAPEIALFLSQAWSGIVLEAMVIGGLVLHSSPATYFPSRQQLS
jgi:hypothetical protein